MFSKSPYNWLGVVFVVSLYALCAMANYRWLNSELLDWVVYQEILNTKEDSFLEIISAVFWCLAAFGFLVLAFRASSNAERCWLIFFSLLSFFAFGEEVSWGYHLFDYSSVTAVTELNAQGETNVHNINVAAILGMTPSDPYYKYFRNISHLLNPLFYLFLSFLWVFLPVVKRYTRLSAWRLIKCMPVPSMFFIVFFFVHAVFFVLVDVLLFNVGYIFEMFIGLAALLVAVDIARSEAARLGLGQDNATGHGS